MLAGLRDDLDAARARGLVSTAGFWVRAAADTLVQGVLERIASSEDRPAYGTVPTTITASEFRLGALLQDARFGLRSLSRSRLSSLVSVVTLGVGIGATTAIFTVVDAVVLEPLPYPESEQLVSIFRTGERSDRGAASALDLQDWREQVASFSEVGAWIDVSSDFVDGVGVEQIPGARLSEGLLPVLGIPTELGRWFAAEEDVLGGPDVIVLSYPFWRDRFGADPDLLGRTIDRNGDPHTVIGVMPEGFQFPTPQAEYWIPLRGDEVLRLAGVKAPGRGLGFLNTVARLSPGTTRAVALADLRAVTAGIDAADPVEAYTGATLISLHEATVGSVRATLFTFLAAVAIVLLISCANVANLALARGSARSTEMAVRAALGAGRARLVQLLVTESVVVGLAAGVVGVVFAIGVTGVLTSIGGDTIPRGESIALDASVLGFTAALSLFTGLLFGVFAALSTSRPRITAGLKEGARGSSVGRGAWALRNGLVVAQVGMALALMTGGGLLINSYYRLTNVDSGFEHENVLTARVSLPPDEYESDESVLTFFDALTVGIRRLPGVLQATTSYSPPLAQSNFNQSVEPEDRDAADMGEDLWAGTVIVGDDFFDASGVPIKRGRGFARSDRSGAPVSVINEAMADLLWPGADPIGKRFRIADGISGSIESLDRRYFSRDWITVVGLAGNVRRKSLQTEAEPEFYRPHAQMAWPGMALLIRTTSDPERLIPSVKSEVRALDSGLAITGINSLTQLVEDSTAGPRFRTTLLVTFALIAGFLAMIGVYGVMAFAVGERRREIGIRMALGASGRRVRREVVGRGLRVAVLGIAVGVVGTLLVSQALSTMVFGISTHDPLTYTVVAAIVLAVAVAASYVPALKASRVDPTGTLRDG